MDWPHLVFNASPSSETLKGPGGRVDPRGREKKNAKGERGHRDAMETDNTKSSPLESCSGGPMLRSQRRGISEVSKVICAVVWILFVSTEKLPNEWLRE